VLMKPLETRELVAAVGPDRTTISS
jgi:hypothetical protein